MCFDLSFSLINRNESITAYIRNGTETFVLNFNILQVPLLIYANRYQQCQKTPHSDLKIS